jgi:quinohemoprotein ethanol dehydrogenase
MTLSMTRVLRPLLKNTLIMSLAISCVLLQACSKHKDATRAGAANKPLAARHIDAEVLAQADSDQANWMIHGRTYSEQRFSPLTQIDKSSVARLKLAWYLDLGAGERGQESTPLSVDGTLYLTTSWSRVIAIDAATGKLRWRYDPKVPQEWGINGCCDVVNRGLAFWDGKVYVGTFDGRLVALDASTGKPLWETAIIDRAERASITGAPRVIKGRVYIGSAGGEFGVRGRLIAVNADTGAILWRFFTVPGDPAVPPENLHLPAAQKTWTGKWWLGGGGGTVWDAMSYDPDLDLLYIGTGNGSPWPQSIRSPKGGDNLYVSSILALKAETGEVAWYYQTTPGDEWGFDAASQLILADLPMDGLVRQVVMQASANGFFYVLDRKDGRLLSATSFVPTTWATGVDLASGRPLEERAARYSKSGKPFLARPGPRGAHSWQPMSFNPATGLVYIPAQINAAQLSVSKEKGSSRYRITAGATVGRPQGLAPDSTELIAWDPLQHRGLWVIERDTPVASGVLSTAGSLLFQGSSNGVLEAFDAASGDRLWRTEAGSPITAAPMTYAINGTQYLAVVVGAGGAAMLEGGEAMHKQASTGSIARLLVYSLSGKAQLPPTSAAAAVGPPPEQTGTPAQIEKGKVLYASYCARCHGSEVINAGPLTGLARAASLGDAKQWNLIAFAGLKGNSGMPGFMAEIKPEDTEAVRAYVIHRAHEMLGAAPE